MPRRFPIFQFPNRPLIVAALAGAAAGIADRRSPAALLVSRLALLVWAVEEVIDGANWFRRLLGLGGGGYALSRLLVPPGSRRMKASGR